MLDTLINKVAAWESSHITTREQTELDRYECEVIHEIGKLEVYRLTEVFWAEQPVQQQLEEQKRQLVELYLYIQNLKLTYTNTYMVEETLTV